ncbi:MAG: DUF4214 domain-containing protein [Pseudomonadota bacterium]
MKRKNGLVRFLTAVLFLLCFTSVVLGETIDIMIVFDSTAKTWVKSNGGMNTFAADAVARMNEAVTNSDIDLTFRLVHAAVVSYTHSGDLGTDLDKLQAGTGSFSVVHQWRDTYGADLVALMVDTGSEYGTVGMGYVLSTPSGDQTSAFTANAIQSVDISHTLTHEVGHNLGCDHSKYQKSSPGPNTALNTYSAGWYFRGTNSIPYHSIMAYDDDGYNDISYTEAPLFSTPLLDYQGTVAGDAKDGDNARTIRETKAVVASYRSSITPITIVVEGPTVSGNISPAGDADWYRFTVTDTGSYTIETSAGTLTDPFMYLYGPDNQETFIESDDGEGRAARIVRGLSAGIYYVKIIGSNNIKTGTYAIFVKNTVVAAPLSLTVPSHDDDGSYTVTWDASSTDSVTYVLEEATNSGFTGGLRQASIGSSTSAFITGRSSGEIFYYRVKATRSGYTDSDWRTGSTGCAVGQITAKQFVVAIYVAFWGRAADPEGLAYWLGLYDDGVLSFGGIAENFALSNEGKAAYTYFNTVFNYPGATVTDSMREEFVVAIYRNLFDREPDAEGLAYWTGVLNSGVTTPGAFIAAIINAAYEGRNGASAEDWNNLYAKIQVAEYYTDKIVELGINWTVNDNLLQAADVLDGINKDSDIAVAKLAIDEQLEI